LLLNKVAILGIISAIVVAGLVFGFAIGNENVQQVPITGLSDNENVDENSTGGRNITIELSDGISFSDNP